MLKVSAQRRSSSALHPNNREADPATRILSNTNSVTSYTSYGEYRRWFPRFICVKIIVFVLVFVKQSALSAAYNWNWEIFSIRRTWIWCLWILIGSVLGKFNVWVLNMLVVFVDNMTTTKLKQGIVYFGFCCLVLLQSDIVSGKKWNMCGRLELSRQKCIYLILSFFFNHICVVQFYNIGTIMRRSRNPLLSLFFANKLKYIYQGYNGFVQRFLILLRDPHHHLMMAIHICYMLVWWIYLFGWIFHYLQQI